MDRIIESAKASEYSALPGVKISTWGTPKRGEQQKLFVEAEAWAKIPLHTHSVSAEMLIVDGEAEVLFDVQQLKKMNISVERTTVRAGDKVKFDANLAHGFQPGKKGLKFISINGGIADCKEQNWDLDMC